MTDHAKRIWLHAIAIVAKARNKCAPGERFEALNLVMGDLEDARRRDQLIMPDFPAVCPDCGQHCETHNGESDCAALQPGEAQVTVADTIAALKAMPTRTEALGGQDFKYIQLGEALDTLRALAGAGHPSRTGRRRQMKALIVGGPNRGQVVDVEATPSNMLELVQVRDPVRGEAYWFKVEADVKDKHSYVIGELCRAYEFVTRGETRRQHVGENGKL